MSSIELKTVLSTAADERTRDLRYRQRQLLSLHQWIINHLVDIESAFCKDDHLSELEARFMVSLVLQELQRHYNALDLKRTLDEEYSVKNGRSNASGKSPEEVVYILPDKYTLFYSVLSVLCTCIASGSCSVIELPLDSTCSVHVISQCLIQSLDRTAFVVTNTRPPSEFLARCLIVDQTGSVAPLMGRRTLRSEPQLWAVAIVDRTANLELAAREIVCSRIFFSGKGSYAPSCILVNEFVERRFIRLLREQLSTMNGHHGSARRNTTDMINQIAPEKTSDTIVKNVLFNTKDFNLIKIEERGDLHLHGLKQTDTTLLLATSSHDDAIDTLHNSNQDSLLALYVFAAPHAAKYLTQFVRSRVSFVNHIPANLLVGPAAPIDYAASPVARYRREMMETPNPKFVTRVSGEFDLAELVQAESKLGQALYNQSLQPLKPTGQPKAGDKNFFAQGMLTGLILLALPLLAGTLAGTTYTIMKLYRHWH